MTPRDKLKQRSFIKYCVKFWSGQCRPCRLIRKLLQNTPNLIQGRIYKSSINVLIMCRRFLWMFNIEWCTVSKCRAVFPMLKSELKGTHFYERPSSRCYIHTLQNGLVIISSSLHCSNPPLFKKEKSNLRL